MNDKDYNPTRTTLYLIYAFGGGFNGYNQCFDLRTICANKEEAQHFIDTNKYKPAVLSIVFKVKEFESGSFSAFRDITHLAFDKEYDAPPIRCPNGHNYPVAIEGNRWICGNCGAIWPMKFIVVWLDKNGNRTEVPIEVPDDHSEKNE
jgi:hypothetical protein